MRESRHRPVVVNHDHNPGIRVRARQEATREKGPRRFAGERHKLPKSRSLRLDNRIPIIIGQGAIVQSEARAE